MYTFISDPGHGWLGVPVKEVEALDIQVSSFSYLDQRQGIVWLEEDLDAGVFAAAKKEADGHTGNHRQWYDDNVTFKNVDQTHIRNLPRYNPPKSLVVNHTLQPKLF